MEWDQGNGKEKSLSAGQSHATWQHWFVFSAEVSGSPMLRPASHLDPPARVLSCSGQAPLGVGSTSKQHHNVPWHLSGSKVDFGAGHNDHLLSCGRPIRAESRPERHWHLKLDKEGSSQLWRKSCRGRSCALWSQRVRDFFDDQRDLMKL